MDVSKIDKEREIKTLNKTTIPDFFKNPQKARNKRALLRPDKDHPQKSAACITLNTERLNFLTVEFPHRNNIRCFV